MNFKKLQLSEVTALLVEAINKYGEDQTVKHGFADFDSWRGAYEELAFGPAENVRLGDMLKVTRAATSHGYMSGYKGGDYGIYPSTLCNIAHYGMSGYDGEHGLGFNVDGLSRARFCKMLGLEVKYVDYSPQEAFSLVSKKEWDMAKLKAWFNAHCTRIHDLTLERWCSKEMAEEFMRRDDMILQKARDLALAINTVADLANQLADTEKLEKFPGDPR
jgi:hypothetical protein